VYIAWNNFQGKYHDNTRPAVVNMIWLCLASFQSLALGVEEILEGPPAGKANGILPARREAVPVTGKEKTPAKGIDCGLDNITPLPGHEKLC
jgi:hypothetical protein